MGSRNIFLSGMMGSGKTSVGKVLAKKMQFSFKDLDRLIEQRTQSTIPKIFTSKGEEYFRKIERQMLMEIDKNAFNIIALGGGTTHFNQVYLQSKCVVFLSATLETLESRLRNTYLEKRPLLFKEGGLSGKLAALWKERQHSYLKNTFCVVNTDKKSIDQIATEIMNKLNYETDN